jgi:ATP-dependent DNA helicase PIF1
MHESSHTVYRLAVHLPLEQPVYFTPGAELQAIEKAENLDSTLKGWFKLNSSNEDAKQYLYHQIPQYYTLCKNKWKKRKTGGSKVISRMYTASPHEGERFYLRLLLLHVKGARTFEDLRSYNKIVYDTFKDAAKARSLLQSDEEWDSCLQEAVLVQMPSQLRDLFCQICVWGNAVDTIQLFEKYKNHFIEDYIKQYPYEFALTSD